MLSKDSYVKLFTESANRSGREHLNSFFVGAVKSIVKHIQDQSPTDKICEINNVIDAYEEVSENESIPWRLKRDNG